MEPIYGDSPGAAKPGLAERGVKERPRKKDPLAPAVRRPLWDELERLFGPVTNDGSRGRRAKAHKLLQQSAASPAEMRARAIRWKARYPKAELTDIALANNWDRLEAEAIRQSFGRRVAAPCDRCSSKRLVGFDVDGVEVPWDDPGVVEIGRCSCIGEAS